jgi:hypothetical protein
MFAGGGERVGRTDIWPRMHWDAATFAGYVSPDATPLAAPQIDLLLGQRRADWSARYVWEACDDRQAKRQLLAGSSI